MRVTIKFVNHPQKPDAKYGNVKTTDDQTIMVPVQRLGSFSRGMTCDIATEQRTWGAGADARPVTVAVGEPSAVEGYTAAYSPPGQAANVAQFPAQTAPAASFAPPRGNPDARMIFATGVVGRAMGSGKFTSSEIDVLLEEALRVYDKRLAGV